MINYIWLFLIFIGVLTGILTGSIDKVTEAAINSAKLGVTLSVGLVGVLSLWLGVMKIAEESGLVKILSKALMPIMKRLFPDIPDNHPAMGSIVMNISANILGLGDAATPLGLKAMQELQTLSKDKSTATNSMCTFLAINTSSVTLIPATVIAYRAAAGSINPTEIVAPAILSTSIATIVAIISVKFFSKLKVFSRTKPDINGRDRNA